QRLGRLGPVHDRDRDENDPEHDGGDDEQAVVAHRAEHSDGRSERARRPDPRLIRARLLDNAAVATAQRTTQEGTPPDLLNRELSWLDLNARVLELAADPEQRLLERIRFCGIFSSNLDEFFMVRVAGLLDQVAAGLGVLSPDGRSPQQALAEVRERVLAL